MREKSKTLTESIMSEMSATKSQRLNNIKTYLEGLRSKGLVINSKDKLMSVMESLGDDSTDTYNYLRKSSDKMLESVFPDVANINQKKIEELKLKKAKEIAPGKEVDSDQIRKLQDEVADMDYAINVDSNEVTLSRMKDILQTWKVKKDETITEEEVPASNVDFFHSELKRIDDKIQAVSDMKALDPENDYYTDLLKAYDSEREVVMKALQDAPVNTYNVATEEPVEEPVDSPEDVNVDADVDVVNVEDEPEI